MSSGQSTIGSTTGSATDQSGQTQSTWNPNAAATPGYSYIAGSAQNLADTPVGYFPGQTYVSPSQSTQMGVNSAMTAAQNYMPQVLGQAGNNYGFLSNAADVANNPYVQAMNAQSTQSLNQNLQQNLLPTISNQAQQVNALGSGRQGLAQGRALGETQQAIADAHTDTNLAAYNSGLSAQQNALGETGSFLQNLLAPGETMMNTGQTVEDYQQSALQDAMDRYSYQYEEPYSRLENLASMLGILEPLGTDSGSSYSEGYSEGYSESDNPNQKSGIQTALGLGTTLAGFF